MYVIIAESVTADPELLAACVELGLSEKVPVTDVKDELLAAFRQQTERDAACGRRTFVKEIARVLSLFFRFPKQKGKGYLSRQSAVTEVYRALKSPEPEE